MALAAKGIERGVERAAPSNLDRVAQRFGARRLANNAMVETLALIISPAQELFRAIDRRTFLVGEDHLHQAAHGAAGHQRHPAPERLAG